MLIENTNVELRCPNCNQKRHIGYPCLMNLASFKRKISDHLCSICRVDLELVKAKFKISSRKFLGA